MSAISSGVQREAACRLLVGSLASSTAHVRWLPVTGEIVVKNCLTGGLLWYLLEFLIILSLGPSRVGPRKALICTSVAYHAVLVGG